MWRRRGLWCALGLFGAALGCERALDPSGSGLLPTSAPPADDHPACGSRATITYVPLPGGHPTEAGFAPVGPDAIVAGPDGSLWMTETSKAIGRLTPDGRFDSFAFSLLSPTTFAMAIAPGPDGNLWFSLCSGTGRGQPGSVASLRTVRSPNSRSRRPSHRTAA